MFVLTRNNVPVRKAHAAVEAWGDNYVAGHPTDCEGVCVFSDGTRMEVAPIPLGADVWRVTRGSSMTYFYGTVRELHAEHGWITSADRLEWEDWTQVY